MMSNSLDHTLMELSRLHAENRRLRRQLSSRTLRELVGQSPAMQALRERVQEIADDERPVLIEGEPGTGTNVVARGIHTAGRRADRPCVRLDCGILSADSLERELFGRNRFAAHPADSADHSDRTGGTLFLDNVHAIALSLQKKLAAVLERRGLEQPGTVEGRPLRARFIAATHADLSQQMGQSLFREDLYRQLSVISITTPTLRERREDICLLTEHFLNALLVREGKTARRVSLEALELLESYDWPGNVRELRNVVERACSLDFAAKLTAEMIRPWLAGTASRDRNDRPGLTLKEMERKLIETTFNRCGGNRKLTAQTLSIGLRTLSGKLREYGYPPRGGPGSNLQVSQPRAA